MKMDSSLKGVIFSGVSAEKMKIMREKINFQRGQKTFDVHVVLSPRHRGETRTHNNEHDSLTTHRAGGSPKDPTYRSFLVAFFSAAKIIMTFEKCQRIA